MEKLEDIIWEKVQIARHNQRPTAKALIKYLFTDFLEMHGDRLFADDRSIIAGIGLLGTTAVTVIAQEKESARRKRSNIISECRIRKVIAKL